MEDETTTNEIMGFLQEHMATKEDLEAFATKEDLEAFATKEDLEAFATKEDLEAFATKEDLEAFATKEDMAKMEHRFIDKMSEKFADLEGSVIARQRKQDNKVNKILELLERHHLAPADEIQTIREMNIFPPPPEI